MDAAQANALLDGLAKAGIARVVASYSGSEDSGQFDGCTAFNAADEEMGNFDFQKPLGEDEVIGAITSRLLNQKHKTLAEQLEQAAWDAVDEAGQGGFWNNEGGEGSLTIDVAERRIWLKHANNTYTDREVGEETDEPLNDDEPDRTLGEPIIYSVFPS
jgi:hypothetical protein